MQQVSSWRKWGVLASVLAVLALAFALFAGTTPAQADEGDLGAGAITTQDEKSKAEATTEWPLKVNLQVGEDKAKEQKTYTQEQFEALKSSGDPVSVVAIAKATNKVFTAKTYVTIDELLADAGISKYWVSGAYLTFESSDGDNGYTYAYDDVVNYKFFPNTTAGELDASDAITAPLVLGIESLSTAIGDDQTAADVAKANATAEGETTSEPIVIAGTTEKDYLDKNMAGKRQWSNIASVTLTITQEAKDQADADAVWPFKVYVQHGSGDPELVKEYTKDQFTALKSSSTDLVSGLYYKGDVWNVSTAVTYVTLDDLLADAGVSWATGATIGYGGDPAQGKSSNSFTYDDLQQMHFYPKTTAGEASTEDAVLTPFVFGLTSSNGGVKIGDDQTAADVQKAAEDDSVSTTAPYAILGSLEDEYKAGTGTTVAGKRLWRNVDSITITYTDDAQTMHRLYNQWSGEHFYTADDEEYKGLVDLGWTDEGTGWTAPVISSTPVYRLYNSFAGEHHYTMKADERDTLVKAGWTDEGTGWYSDDAEGVVLYREYNPNELANNHNYTTSKEEHDGLVKLGWTDEGKAWYGVKTAE